MKQFLKIFRQGRCALFLAALLLAITLLPLSSLALQSVIVMHAITGACTGECRTCGCPAEQRERRTCCCWQSRLQDEHSGHDSHRDVPGPTPQEERQTNISRCCPCNEGQQLGWIGMDEVRLLPTETASPLPCTAGKPPLGKEPGRPQDRKREPPDPPPEQTDLPERC